MFIENRTPVLLQHPPVIRGCLSAAAKLPFITFVSPSYTRLEQRFHEQRVYQS